MKCYFYRIRKYFSSDIFLYIALILPKRIQLWCFILVNVNVDNGTYPKVDDNYREKYENFVEKHKLRNKGF